MPDDFFRFIADAAIQTVVGLYQGRKPKIRVGLEWDEPKEDHTAPYAGPGTAPRAGEEEAEDTVWPEAFDQ